MRNNQRVVIYYPFDYYEAMFHMSFQETGKDRL